MRILGFGEGLIQDFDKVLQEHPKEDEELIKWNYLIQAFDPTCFHEPRLNTALTREELELILKEIRVSLHLRRFKNFEYNESK